MNGSRANQGAQWENHLVPRTPSEKGIKLLADAQMATKGPSKQRLGQSVPDNEEDNRDVTIKLMQAHMVELRQVLVPNTLKMSSWKLVKDRPRWDRFDLNSHWGQIEEQTNPILL